MSKIAELRYVKHHMICFRDLGRSEIQTLKPFVDQVYQVEFVILCIGLYSGCPNIPDFPPDQGPEMFNGKVMHSMEYSAMDNLKALEFIKRKRITIIGSQKSALDIAAECANINGKKIFLQYPCNCCILF